jgi:hypothetical protein
VGRRRRHRHRAWRARGLGFSAWEVRTPDDATVASGFGVAEIADERITRMWTVLYAPE